MTLTDKEFITLVQKNRENEDVDSDGFKEIIAALDDKANVNSNSEGYGTPLHIAAKYGNIPLVKLFLEKGADINYNKPPGMYNRKYTPLHHVIDAISTTDRDIKFLAPTTATGLWTAKTEEGRIKQREEAAEKLRKLQGKRNEVVKFLLEQENIDVNKKNFHDNTPIENTVYNKYYDLTKLLLDKGADPKVILNNDYYIENNHTKMFDDMLNLLMEYAVKDSNYKPNDNAHQRVKDAFKPYQDKIVDEVANKKEVSEDVAKDVKSFLDGSGKRKSRKSKAKKSKKSNKAKKIVKKHKTRKNKKSKK